MTIRQTLTSVMLWVLGVFLAATFGIICLSYTPTFPYAFERLPMYGPRILTTWAHFDGVHYLTIIEKGYEGTGLIQAFFPFYPLLVRGLSVGVLNPIVVGMLISIGSLVAGFLFLHKLLTLDESPEVVSKTLLLLLLAPTSFFFMSLYTESLFLLLIVLSFYCARTNRWWWAGLFGALASATRLVGIFLIPALLYEYWLQHRLKLKPKVVSTIVPAFGLGAFMRYLYKEFGDPLLFFTVQKDFGTARETSRIILLYQVFYRYIKMFLTVPVMSRVYYITFQEFVAGLFGLTASIVGWFTIRRSYVIFSFLAYLVPTLTGTFTSLPRYLLPLFPLYLVLAKLLPHWLYVLILLMSVMMLVINLLLYTQGLWVA